MAATVDDAAWLVRNAYVTALVAQALLSNAADLRQQQKNALNLLWGADGRASRHKIGCDECCCYNHSICPTLFFVDDTKCYTIHPDISTNRLQQDLDKKHDTTNDWNRKFNPDNCNTLHFGKKTQNTLLNNQPINNNITEKDLGITINNKLHFSVHINNITNKASRTLNAIKHNFTT
ncbi:hypothetical protein CAPTEDRAFT_217226 [Capitella teleta]|uniref:Uncharacterized protein n=1 Tax=Capitella teleta TaxID=283909 RepID=R7U3V3_CAPTE|nr:hypothetical protein CAPTEDRAFT_217226 [Capitella teleta]|eukprot:ELT97830.1 hypothetical protein CAPTEDRAFT_217226 [Capitella teleta]